MEIEKLKESIKTLLNVDDLKTRVNLINELRECIHEESPFKNEPVDFVKWELNDNVVANDYNPNKVAPPGI